MAITAHLKSWLHGNAMRRSLRPQNISFAYQEVEHAEAQHLEGDADVAVVVEPVQHLNAQAANTRDNIRSSQGHGDARLRHARDHQRDESVQTRGDIRGGGTISLQTGKIRAMTLRDFNKTWKLLGRMERASIRISLQPSDWNGLQINEAFFKT